MKKHKLANIYLCLVFILLYAPIIYLVIYSFNAGDYMSGWEGFSLVHYQDLLSDNRIWAIVVNTLLVAVISSVVATVVGTIGAIYVYNLKKRHQKDVTLSLNNILLVSPDVIIGASFLILFTAFGFQLGLGSVLLSHIAFSIPIVVIMVLPKLNEMPATYVRSAQDLGATAWQTMSRVVLPVISPGILSGFFMALTYSLDDFAVTFFVTGNGFTTLSVEIYSRARRGINLEINALSALLFAVSLLLVLGYYFIQKQQNNKGRQVRA